MLGRYILQSPIIIRDSRYVMLGYDVGYFRFQRKIPKVSGGFVGCIS